MVARRRSYWIDIRTQGPFLLKVGSVWTGGVVLLCLLLYFLSDEELGRSFYSVHLRVRNTWEILLPAVIASGGVSFLLTIGATVWLAMRESHRLGGPVFKFKRLFRQLEEGSFDPEFHLRKGDLLVEMGESYRAALSANRERIASVQELSRRAEAALENVQSRLGPHGLPAEDAALLAESLELVAGVRKALKAFDVGVR